MATEREPPPLGDAEQTDFRELEDGEDLFISTASTLESSPTSPEPASHPAEDICANSNGPQPAEISLDDDLEDLFAEATEEVSLDSPEREPILSDEPSPAITPVTPTALVTPRVEPKTIFVPAMFERSKEELEEEANGDSFDMEIVVSDPEKVGDGMNAYMAYKVTTKTSLTIFNENEFSVKRRFSDFLGLHSKLATKYMHIGYIVPPAPEKSIVGMTKVKVGKEDSSSTEFVEKRRAALERYLERTVKHPTLLHDPDVMQFLESSEVFSFNWNIQAANNLDNARLPRAVSTQALSGAGILRMVNKAAEAVNKMTIKMNESDAWFEEKQQQFENLDQQLRKLHTSVESLVCHRKELSVNTAAFAKSAAMLGNSEDHTALSRALSQLAEVEEKIDQLHQEQAYADFYLFAELLSDYVRLLTAVKGVFDQRMKTWQKWQDAQAMLQKKREAESKLQFANKPDKLQQAKDEIREATDDTIRGELSITSRVPVATGVQGNMHSLMVRIPSFRFEDSAMEKGYTVFKIDVLTSGRQHSVEKRYSEFHSLHKKLKKFIKAPEMPSKHVRNWVPKVLEHRRLGLEIYLQSRGYYQSNLAVKWKLSAD
ncbi:Sorting nexin-2 [Acipenser ruthenus]|uniref:Sorting nexin-2 n=1 Tax=Acipenser ruthenus TaxID=7906 RepID=A0A662YTL4_ACIRT|nr:Sorting nexin-2 [Acipenser ruthenus]